MQCSDDLLRSVSLPSHPDLLAEKLQTRSILTLHLVSFQGVRSLFWGWFRTLMVYTLYGVVAGAILRVFMGVGMGMGYVTTYTGALMGTGSSDPAELGKV